MVKGKFVGYEHISGTAKKTGNPYDFVKLYCTGKMNENVIGSSCIEVMIDTNEVEAATGATLAALQSLLDKDIEFTFGFSSYGKCVITGFSLLRPATQPVQK